jgi:hypothetical protein
VTLQEGPEVQGRHARRQVDEHVLVALPIDADRKLVREEPQRLPGASSKGQVREVAGSMR